MLVHTPTPLGTHLIAEIEKSDQGISQWSVERAQLT